MTVQLTDFGDLLRRHRLKANLSQEELAERSGVSVDAISRNERGLRWAPRRETIALLVGALQLSADAKAEFEEAATLKRYGAAPSSGTGHNLPWQPTSFVGRQREIGEITGLLAPRRLVTITGAGGIGKTRVSLEIASRLEQIPRGGIWFVDLAPVHDLALVLSKLASLLDIQLPEQGDALSAMVSAIKGRELLLILDNCEHVIVAIRSLAGAILKECPHITLLATSRERLGTTTEIAYRLSTLATPAKDVTTASEGRTYDALELFVERAATAKPDFLFSDDDVEGASAICRRLDGIALAIELAAARLPVLGLSGLQTQLAEHFRIVAAGHHDRPARQQTLHAVISWSHDLLNESERIVFRRLAIFASGWTLDAAVAVCPDDLLGKVAVVDTLLSLVEKSLVLVDLDTATTRYSFFESTRVYALDKLAASGEAAELARRHASWMASFADRADDMLGVAPRSRLEAEVAPEFDNALAALEWAFGTGGDYVLAGRIASGLRGCWQSAGLNAVGQRYLDIALERIDSQEHPKLVARLLLGQTRSLGTSARTEAMKRAISLLEHSDDQRTLARCYNNLADALARTGDFSDADEAYNMATALLCEEGLQRSPLRAGFLVNRSVILRAEGRFDEAKAALTEALAVAESVDDDWSVSVCRFQLAEIEFSAGNVQRAVELGEHTLALLRRTRGAFHASSLNNLACYRLILGETDAAEANAREALTLAHTVNPNPISKHTAIQHLAAVAAVRGQTSHAARLLGYVDAWRERVGRSHDPTDQRGYDVLMAALHGQLSDEEIAALAMQGSQLTEDAAVDEALAAG